MTDSIRSVLKLADDAKDEDIIAAVKALSEQKTVTLESTDVVALSEYQEVKKLAEDAQKAADAAGKIAAASQKELADLHRDTWFTEQVRSGKITPAEQEATLALYDAAPDQTKALIEARPVNRSLTTVVGLSGGTSEPMDLATKEGRDALDAEARRLSDASGGTLSYVDALFQAEKALTS